MSLMSLQRLAYQRSAESAVAQLQSAADSWVLQCSGKGGSGGTKQEAGKEGEEEKDDKADEKSPEGAASGKEAVEAVDPDKVKRLHDAAHKQLVDLDRRMRALLKTMKTLTAWRTLGHAYQAAHQALKSTTGETIRTIKAYNEASARLSHWVRALKGMVKDLEAQAARDSAYTEMDSATYADALGHFALAPAATDETGRGSGGAALSRIQLYGGGLHSEAIGIIESYYREDFTLDDLLATESEEAILDLLYEDESAKILEVERAGGSPIKAKDRRFYKVDEATKQASEAALRAELRPKAAEQARGHGVTPKESGQLRSWHLNDTGRLPRKVLKNNNIKEGFADKTRKASTPDFAGQPAATARGLLHGRWLADLAEGGGFQAGYIEDYGTAAKKGGGAAAFRSDARQQEPGYIEINAAGWTESKSQGRLLYDYLSDLWYITLDHYNEHFFEIIVPPEVKRLAAGKAGPASKADTGKKTDAKSGAETAPPETAMNNCLLDAIHGAATAAGFAPAALNYAVMREDLEARGLGARGTMLYADQQVVERILTALGINGTPVILYQADGTAQEVGGEGDDAGGQVIQIYHTGALHYVGHPTTPAQIGSAESRRK